MDDYWRNKVCLVTGASAGLGLAISQEFAAQGAKLLLVARGPDTLEKTASQLRAAGADVDILPADVTHQHDIDQLAQHVEQTQGAIDCLCNCAGRSTRQAVLDTTADDFQDLWEINFLSTVRMTRAFADGLIQRRGHLVNIGSLAGKVAPRYMGAYPASKFAVAAYSQQLRLELGPRGLHVLVVHPGPIRRDTTEPRYQQEASQLPPEAQKPGAGARLRGIAPDKLAREIVAACQARKPELIIPRKVRLLLALGAISPRLGDWVLQKMTRS